MENTPTYNTGGSWTAFVGIIVLLLAKFGVIVDPSTVITIGAAVVALIGIFKQFRDHKKLAIAVGAIKK